MTSLINTKTGVENKDWTNFRNSIEQLIGIANSYQLLLDCTYVTAEYEKITGMSQQNQFLNANF